MLGTSTGCRQEGRAHFSSMPLYFDCLSRVERISLTTFKDPLWIERGQSSHSRSMGGEASSAARKHQWLPSMSRRSRELPRGQAALAHLSGALGRDLAPSGPASPSQDLWLGSAGRRGTPKPWQQSPTGLATTAYPGHVASAWLPGMRHPCTRSWATKSPRPWDNPMGCWCSTHPPCPRPARHRWGGEAVVRPAGQS